MSEQQQPIDQFITVDFFKLMIQSTDEQDDNLYEQFVNNANTKVDNSISRYITVPIGGGSQFFSRCRNAALVYARMLLAIDIELIEKSKDYREMFNLELYGQNGTESSPMAGGLIQEIISTRTEKTKVTLVSFDPRNFKVVLPSQLDLAATERFQ